MLQFCIPFATLGERGQVTIPKEFRTKLGFTPGTVLTFKIDGKTLRVAAQREKPSPFDEARGILKGAFGGISTDELIREMRGRRRPAPSTIQPVPGQRLIPS